MIRIDAQNNHPPPDSKLSRPPWERGQLKCIAKTTTQSKHKRFSPLLAGGPAHCARVLWGKTKLPIN